MFEQEVHIECPRLSASIVILRSIMSMTRSASCSMFASSICELRSAPLVAEGGVPPLAPGGTDVGSAAADTIESALAERRRTKLGCVAPVRDAGATAIGNVLSTALCERRGAGRPRSIAVDSAGKPVARCTGMSRAGPMVASPALARNGVTSGAVVSATGASPRTGCCSPFAATGIATLARASEPLPGEPSLPAGSRPMGAASVSVDPAWGARAACAETTIVLAGCLATPRSAK